MYSDRTRNETSPTGEWPNSVNATFTILTNTEIQCFGFIGYGADWSILLLAASRSLPIRRVPINGQDNEYFCATPSRY
jgi:hypothetical protein